MEGLEDASPASPAVQQAASHRTGLIEAAQEERCGADERDFKDQEHDVRTLRIKDMMLRDLKDQEHDVEHDGARAYWESLSDPARYEGRGGSSDGLKQMPRVGGGGTQLQLLGQDKHGYTIARVTDGDDVCYTATGQHEDVTATPPRQLTIIDAEALWGRERGKREGGEQGRDGKSTRQ